MPNTDLDRIADLTNLAFINLCESGNFDHTIYNLVMYDIPALVARARELEAENTSLKEIVERDEARRAHEGHPNEVHNWVDMTEKVLPRLRELEKENDNAALRLAATELYEFVTRGVGTDPSYGPVARMANVLGLSKEGE
jgi:hypothetical protein